MAPPKDLPPRENDGFFSSYHLLTLYFPAFVFALGYSIATPAIPVFAKSFDTGFGVASLVIVMHALGGLLAAVPTGFLVDRMGRRPILIAGPLLVASSSCLIAVAQSFGELLVYRLIGGAAMEMWRQARLAIIADVRQAPAARPADERHGRHRGRRPAHRPGARRIAGGVEYPGAVRRPRYSRAVGHRAKSFSHPRIGAVRNQERRQQIRRSARHESRDRLDARRQVPRFSLRPVLRVDDSRRALGRHAALVRDLRVRTLGRAGWAAWRR